MPGAARRAAPRRALLGHMRAHACVYAALSSALALYGGIIPRSPSSVPKVSARGNRELRARRVKL